jgi:putative membrane-bound dehydrogenase-like protein
MTEFIAIALFALFFCSIAGGIALLLRVRTRRRWSGLAFIGFGVASAGLLALMSSKYWFGDEIFFHSFIDISIVQLFGDVAKIVLALALAVALTVALASWVVSRIPKQRWWGTLGAALAALILLDAGGTAALVALSKPPEEDQVSPVGRTLRASPGFQVELFSSASAELSSPTALAVGPDQRLYVSDITGHVWSMPTDQGMGVTPQLYAEGFREPLGLAWRERDLYVASLGTISILRDQDGDGRAEERRDIAKDLPARLFPLHQNNAIKFGPDGRLYFGLGAANNSAHETNELTATILSVNPDGSDLQVFARGLRNAYGLAFNASGEMFATDNAPQGMAVVPGDELNHIERGKDYGYPESYEQPLPGGSSVGPVYIFPPHSSPDGITFYNGNAFPPEYADNAFVTSWMRGEIYRFQMSRGPDGTYMTRASIIASGFKNPLDVTVGPDGNLFIADFGANAIYQLSYGPSTAPIDFEAGRGAGQP